MTEAEESTAALADALSRRVADRLAAARARLVLEQPFLGALVLRLPLRPAGWCQTTATDARALYYNPGWIDRLSNAQTQFALAHEALHCALGHFARRGHRVRRKWDLACDFAINPLLLDAGLTPPPETVVLTPYRGMAAEEIYPCLDDSNDEGELMDEHPWEGETGAGAGQTRESGAGGTAPPPAASTAPPPAGESGAEPMPSPLSAREKEQLRQQWQRHLAAAARRAREAGKLSGPQSRLTAAALAAPVSWRALLARYLTRATRDDYTWQRPSRRAEGGAGNVIWPGLHSHGGDIHVAIDVSGSIAAADLAEFFGELNALKGTLPVRITLHACDSALIEGAPWVIEPWEALRLPASLAGGGDTSFVPVFEWIERHGQRPDALIYFTDAEGVFPARAPAYPVLWLVKGKAPVPFGRRVALNE